MLNVVNFGAGTYVLYAEIGADGMIEVDPEPYGDSFARPARLLPVEAKALIAAIDLIGEHIPEGSLSSVRAKVVAALGEDPVQEGLQIAPPVATTPRSPPVVSRAIARRRLLSFEYYKENEDEFSTRTVEPYALINGREGWYVASFDPSRDDVRHFRLDRIKSATVTDETFEPRSDVDPAADVDGWPRTGEVPVLAPGAHVDLPGAGALGARGADGRRRARGRRGGRRARLRRRATGSCARCSRRPATRSCSSRRTLARPSARPPRRSATAAASRRAAAPDEPRATQIQRLERARGRSRADLDERRRGPAFLRSTRRDAPTERGRT